MSTRWEDPDRKWKAKKALTRLRLDTKIKTLRRGAGLTQTQLAARSGMAGSKISAMERASRNLTVETLWRLAQATGTTLDIRFATVRKATTRRTR